MARAFASPKRSAPNIPKGPLPAIESTLVAGSTRPGGSRATRSWSFFSVAAILSASTQEASEVRAGWVTFTPQGMTSSPRLASAPSSLVVVVALRLVMPVTTAKGKEVGSASVVVVGLAVAAVRVEGALAGVLGPGLPVVQAATIITPMTSAVPRSCVAIFTPTA